MKGRTGEKGAELLVKSPSDGKKNRTREKNRTEKAGDGGPGAVRTGDGKRGRGVSTSREKIP